MRENEIEHKLAAQVRKAGGLCLKFTSPGMAGVPDRLLLLTGGRAAFVEVKAPGRKLRPLQIRRKRQLESLGFRVYVLDGPAQIPAIIQQIGGKIS